MKDTLRNMTRKHGRLIIGIGILGCLALLALGFVKPKIKLQTVAVNMSETGRKDIRLEEGTTLTYTCSTKGYAMYGIQVGISKRGKGLSGASILCSVYDEAHEQLLSQTLISMDDVDDGQFVYIPFDHSELCSGTIVIDFTGTGCAEGVPALLVNDTVLEDASTSVNGQPVAGDLMSSYVYALKYHLLMYDLLVALSILVGVFFLAERKVAAHE